MAPSVDDPLDERSFRDVMSQFATGVILLTACTDAGAAGMAINSFASLSLRPPLVTFGAAPSSATWPYGAYRELVRHRHPRCQSRGSASSLRDERNRSLRRSIVFDSPARHPIVDDALVWLECQIASVHAGGDHDLVIARAMQWSAVHGVPLVFYSGEFRSDLIKDPAKGDE